MRYLSTRGGAPPLTFKQAVMDGLAGDGGLFVPERIPCVRAEMDALRGLSFTDLAKALLPKFMDDISPARLAGLVDQAYAGFSHPQVVPLVRAGNVRILELFHGPTLAFKDLALQLLGRLFADIVAETGEHLNILGATSGDTGSAAIASVCGQAGIDIHILYPHGRISPLQELQMTTVPDANVHCLAVEGSFDDCQSLVKGLLGDAAFRQRRKLGAVNSVNWARIAAQACYYGYASLQYPEPVSFCVPTGNFGNVFAGYLARRMGFPIRKLIVATNENDILSGFFNSGRYQQGQVRFTLSPAMDIQVASNFERFLYYHLDEDAARVSDLISGFQSGQPIALPPPANSGFLAASASDAQTLAAIRGLHQASGYVCDPHTGVGVAVASALDLDEPVICLATAHPAKFPEAVTQALGAPVTHPSLDALADMPQRSERVPASRAAVQAAIKHTADAAASA